MVLAGNVDCKPSLTPVQAAETPKLERGDSISRGTESHKLPSAYEGL